MQKVKFCNRLCIFLPIPGPLKELRMCSTTVNAAAVSLQLSAPCSSGNWEISGSFCVFFDERGDLYREIWDDGHENVKKRKTFGEREKFRLSIGLTYYKIGGRIIPWRSVNMGRRKEWIPMSQIRYKRILLKLSGEALAGGQHRGLDFDTIGRVCDVVGQCVAQGVQVAIVVGGGNFWRGLKDGSGRMERTRADHMGMLATTINALAVADCLEQREIPVRVQTAIEMKSIAEPYIRGKAIAHLERGRVVIFGCGTGNPYFSTDTGAVLRGVEIGADAILLAKNVDGVYSADPAKDPTAQRYDHLTYDEVLARHLQATDTTAMTLAMDNQMPIIVFELKDPQNILRVVQGEKIGTIIKED